MLALVFILGTITPAYADRISDKQAEAAAVRAQIDALDDKVEIAIEDYNEAADRYAKVSKQVRDTERSLGRIRGKMTKVQDHLYTRADNMYRTGPLGFVEVLLNAKSFDDFNTTWDLLTDLNEKDASSVAELKDLKHDAEATQKKLKTAQASAKKQKARMASNKKAVLTKLDERKQKLATVNADIRGLVAAQRAAEAAEARRAFLASRRSSGSTWQDTDTGGDPPSNASRGEKVVYYAKTKLGAPYVWGATGPNSFDCSGLTSWAYRKVGVSLPRVSREQIGAGSRVSKANLEPGDLVFFGRSRIHHVGIYVGGGKYIHAPSSGDVVKISSLGSRSDYAGACRP